MPAVPHTCPLCEASCGLLVSVDDDGSVLEIRGDPDDVLSQGFLCPKGVAVKSLHTDPDRLRTPMVRWGGMLREATWTEAFDEIAHRLPALQERHGRDCIAVFSGVSADHALGPLLYTESLIQALGTRNVFSAASLNSRPRHVVSGMLYGNPFTTPVPDIDRSDFVIMIGANPVVSNGSMLTAPDLRSKLRALRRRGGRIVVVDPRRTESADGADEHLRVRPGTDGLLLLAMLNVLLTEGLVNLGDLADFVDGVDGIASLAEGITPERVERRTEVDAGSIRRVVREFARADAGVVYGRIGASTTSFATVTTWLIDVLNVLTGNLDRPGGAMFPQPGHGGLPNSPRKGVPPEPFTLDGPRSRVSRRPVLLGEVPAAALAEEIDTPGFGQVRGLITIGGNPARSIPNSKRLYAALNSLDLMISVDTYLNETSALADVVLPVPSILERSHYELIHYNYAYRNVAKYSPPVLDLPIGMYPEWETIARLALIAANGSYEGVEEFDDRLAAALAVREGIPLDQVGEGLRGPERLLDILLQAGEYGLTMEHLQLSPNGLELGDLEPRLPEALLTEDRRIHLAPQEFLTDAQRVRALLDAPAGEGMLLVGRRHLRSKNSWLHNLSAMVTGPRRCTLQVNEEDAYRLGLRNGGRALVTSAAGRLVASVEITDEVLPGVVSLPHGWGHDEPQARMTVAAERPGVNVNLLTDDADIDPLTGNAVFNGVRVTVVAHAGDAPDEEQPMPNRRQGFERRRTPRGPGGIGPESFGPA
ncbi:molybdopterin-dependent oxidoreductase [Sporichthya polymorpha]|uniref:molybdopterin-dependent oxidoreductase n=1 Tax=Sporichthya polymorpha TaxID=35751 RepID=UPI000A059F37|nr:molybdopterin-dependent oxidoreductase [Sporichthya polymorpha]